MSNTEVAQMVRLQEEALFHLNLIKNAQGINIGDGQILTRLYTGQKIFVDATDTVMTPALVMDGFWEREVTDLLLRTLRPGDCFIDVGSTMGYFGLLAGTVIKREQGGSIHMIEPDERRLGLIYKSINVTGLLGTAAVAQLAGTLDQYAESQELEAVNVVRLALGGDEERVYRQMSGIIEYNRHRLTMLIDFVPAGYEDPPQFFARIEEDFGAIHQVDRTSGLQVEVTSYQELESVCSRHGHATLLVANQNQDLV